MSKRRSGPHPGSVLELADAIGREERLSLSDKGFVKKVGGRIRRLIEQARANPAYVHGRRTELMFGYLAASLGACKAIKREDAGELISLGDADVLIPDYRLLLRDGSQQLVEVKNCHHADGSKELRLREGDVARLRAYADLFGLPLRFAIYWSRWHLWSLITEDDMRLTDSKYRTSLVEALASNRMLEIGDFHLATTPPATLRILADPRRPREVGPDGRVTFTIGDIKMFAADIEVTAREERDLLLYMIFYGNWIEREPEAHIIDGRLAHVDFVYEPTEPGPDQPFDLVGAMSSMVSNQYLNMTTHGTDVTRLAPSVAPDRLGRRRPGRVADMTLPLWVFILRPQEGTAASNTSR